MRLVLEPRGPDEGALPPPRIDGLAEGRETDGERNVDGLEGERDENDGLDTDGVRGAGDEGALDRYEGLGRNEGLACELETSGMR
jgi:hypothetical protein